MRRFLVLIFLITVLFAPSLLAYEKDSIPDIWDTPQPVTPKTVFFGEKIQLDKEEPDKPAQGDKSYPWYHLEKGDQYTLEKDYDRASVYFREAYSVPGPTRVLSGFRLVESLTLGGRVKEALDVLDEMENSYLVSPREFEEARRLKNQLLDDHRRSKKKPVVASSMNGKEWNLQLQAWRIHYVLEAMDHLRRHGVPTKESAYKYVFLLDEHFLAHPEASADDANEVLAALIYERDSSARVAIDRWRASPEGTLTEEARAFDRRSNQITGAEWVLLVHNDKMAYVSQAMAVLRAQRVPMEKTLYGYTDALDKLFTRQPDLPAADGAVALASYLHQAEPEARAVLDALRLE